MDALCIERLFACQFEKGLQYVATNLGGAGPPGYPKVIAVTGDLDIEAALDLAQVFIELTAQICKAVIVGGFEDDIPGDL
jgi:hypothetical protein